MIIYVIRHGETEWNRTGRIQGRSDISLNEKGRAAARRRAEELKAVSFDHIYSSPLMRAMETAEIVTGNRDVPLTVDERLVEICFGELEGSCQLDKEDPKMQAFDKFFQKPAAYEAPGGAESFAELSERTGDFLTELANKEEHKNQTILISTHGAAKCSILNNIDNTSAEMFWRIGLPPNCAYSVLECADGIYRIKEEYKVNE